MEVDRSRVVSGPLCLLAASQAASPGLLLIPATNAVVTYHNGWYRLRVESMGVKTQFFERGAGKRFNPSPGLGACAVSG